MKRSCIAGDLLRADLAAADLAKAAKVASAAVKADLPMVDLEGEKRLHALLLESIGEGLFASCHDISDGGLAVCLAESAILSEQGAYILMNRRDFPHELPPSALLFGEAQGRVVVTVRTEKQLAKLTERAGILGLRADWIGTVGGQNLRMALGPDVLIDIPIAKLAATSADAIPRRMEGRASESVKD